MGKRVLSWSIDHHVEEHTKHRSFDTLEAARAFAEGKNVVDIYRAKGRFKVEYLTVMRVNHDDNR